ncbi:TolC family protein [uncultured Psychrosphaera sp.]|uniref:TolC family protein n=1 Tax=uncultured Psychrosphaera sp. TaxID=1403522 RepID=UPI0030F85E54
MFSNKSNVNIVFVSALISLAVNATDTSITNVHVLTIEQAIKTAQTIDPWLAGNMHQQQALESLAQASGSLPDPNVSMTLANLPMDGFDFSQEAMTQVKIGLTQVFPRGDTLALKSKRFKRQSEAFPFQRLDRKAKIALTVGSLWLDGYRVQKSISLIEQNRALFEQLADVAEASYSSALGKTRQQDIVRAQLELSRLDERLDILRQQKHQFEGLLSKWLVDFDGQYQSSKYFEETYDVILNGIDFGERLPQIELQIPSNEPHKLPDLNRLTSSRLINIFNAHPGVIAIDKKVSASKTGISMAQQQYHPQWGVNASYGYRDDAPSGIERSDFFSIGVTFDLPLFTDNKQDKEVDAAISKTEAVKTEKLILLKQHLSAYTTAIGRLGGIKRRQALYKSKLLPQIHDHAEATLSAYTHDDGDFSDVVRSRIALLNTVIDELNLNVEQQQLHLELNYLFIGNSYSISSDFVPMEASLMTTLNKNDDGRVTELNVTNRSQFWSVKGDN